jgi:DNA polymerase-3 subunit delta'
VAEGNYSQAMQMVAEEHSNMLELTKGIFQKAYVAEPLAMMGVVEIVAQMGRDDQKYLFHFMSQILSMSLRSQNGLLKNEAGTNEIMNYVHKLSTSIGLEEIGAINELIDDSIFGIQRNANMRILLLDFLIQLSKILRKFKK